jgi:hypothetical protein
MTADGGGRLTRRSVLLTGAGVLAVGCGAVGCGSGSVVGSRTAPVARSGAPGSPTATPAAPSAAPSLTPTSAAAGSSAPAPRTPTSDSASSAAPRRTPPKRLSLAADRRNAMAFASLDHPTEITVEGRVAATQAWSTSKVLIVAAFLDTVADGEADKITDRNRKLITSALTASDADAVNAIRDQIPGRPGPAMTSVLRSIGDHVTTAPGSSQGLMRWSLREQVRFMAALAAGQVVSRSASSYLRKAMRPIRAHAWGLGRIGATTYKGGWLRASTATRQMGIVEGYAVAIITTAGPAVRQTDGDSAHVRQMNRLARLLEERLSYERSQR